MDGNYVHEGGGSPTLNGKFHFRFPFLFWGELPKLPQLSNSWPIICCDIITEFVFVIQLMNCLCLCSALAWRSAGTSRALQDQSAKKAAKSIVPAPIEGAASNLWIQFIWLLFVFYSCFQSYRLVLWHGAAQDIYYIILKISKLLTKRIYKVSFDMSQDFLWYMF